MRDDRHLVPIAALSLTSLFLFLGAAPGARDATHGEPPEPPRHHYVHPYFGGRVGYLRVSKVDPGSLNVGLEGGYAIRTMLAIEGSFDYHTGEYGVEHRRTDAYELSAYLYPLPFLKVVRPYAVGGVGYYTSEYEPIDEFDTHATEDRSAGGTHLGGGVEFWLNRKTEPKSDLRLVVDYRYIYSSVGPEGRRQPVGKMITLGLKVRSH